jgi:Holliday junction resolvasome RuvABC endonuclease subunit
MSIGIDYSMTCPAACALDPDNATPRFWYAHTGKLGIADLPHVSVTCVPEFPQEQTRTVDRARFLAKACLAWIERAPVPNPVLIEDYAFSATGRVFHIGENAGILKYVLGDAGLLVFAVPPTVVKRYATGKGNADKYKMTQAFLEAYPEAQAWIRVLFPRFTDDSDPARSPLADLADAYWIARYAARYAAQYAMIHHV